MSNPYSNYGVSDEAASLAFKASEAVLPIYEKIEKIREINQLRVMEAFRSKRFSEPHLGLTTGYGYDDIGREKIEEVFADIMGAQKAYVRIQISSGTQAISSMLFGILRPGDKLLSATGRPYDTLAATLGLSAETYDGSLSNYGIEYDEVELKADGTPDIDALLSKIDDKVKVVFIQKSRGYTGRRALRKDDIKSIIDAVHGKRKDIIVAVDNCYGEFTEDREPCSYGADICAGSMIKNPGGGIAPSGGYIAGREDLVEKVARHICAPGLGSEVGPSLGFNRQLAQGIFMAPHVVAECLKGAVFAAAAFELAGIKTSPSYKEERGDIVQTIIFDDPDKLVSFCGKVQSCSPVDSFVTPEPWDMPGYEDKVVMAAGTFTSGATTEFSCDGPLKPPYIAYMQGGLVYEQVKLAVMRALS
ncbi:MAG: aminotransferase class V-fold PLP-dependent enzyme [Clostridiales bacterium]|nr:aminotransferase class V-fold PLP-dependent enzyme [Clostridiales bacterium]